MVAILLTHTEDSLEIYFGRDAVRRIEAVGEVRFNRTGRPLSGGDLIRAARRCEIIVSDRNTPGPSIVFEQIPGLVAFIRVAVDTRTIDVDSASKHGVLVTRVSPGFTASVVELIIGHMVCLARGLPGSVIAYRNGQQPVPAMGRQLRGSTLGVIGYGTIGRYLCEVAKALGMTVLVADPHIDVTDLGIRHLALEELLGRADFVVCLAAATAETENLMDGKAFAQMKAGAYFINASRGGLVDENALAEALRSGHLAGAAMDVGRAPDHMPSPALAGLPNVIATPHIGGLTLAAVAHAANDTVAQVEHVVKGRMPPGAVNASAATRLARLRGRWLPLSI